MSEKLINYLRVSTKRQGESGLGLEAQRAAVQAYAQASSGDSIAEYIEVESGKLANRPELAKALAHARRSKARLVIAKLDRLARNVAFISALMENGTDFVACDNPHANKLTLHILAAVAQDEAHRISERTIAALAAAKRRGTLLGSARKGHWEGRESARLTGLAKGRKVAAEKRNRAALDAVADLLPVMQQRRQDGASFQQIADEINAAGHTTRRRKEWGPMAVKRALDRAGEMPAVK